MLFRSQALDNGEQQYKDRIRPPPEFNKILDLASEVAEKLHAKASKAGARGELKALASLAGRVLDDVENVTCAWFRNPGTKTVGADSWVCTSLVGHPVYAAAERTHPPVRWRRHHLHAYVTF